MKVTEKNQIPHLRLRTIIIIVLSSALVSGAVYLSRITRKNGGELTTISKSSLQKIVEIQELSTVEYIYNATATKYDKNKAPMYHVAYEGTVTAGIDFNKIGIDITDDEKKIEITIPEIEIFDTKVDMGTLEYIFIKDKYETETVSQEAYKLCKEDLKSRVDKENTLYDTARENAKSSAEALFKPWIDTIDSGYTLEIK